MTRTDITRSRWLYWRIDHKGWPLSRSFRSASLNTDHVEEGTSSYSSLEELLTIGGYARGPVAIVAFDGDLVGYGEDNEPVVIPSGEVARWEHPDWNGLPRDVEAWEVETEDDLLALGWVRVSTLDVV